MGEVEAGWFIDPMNRSVGRYWDGVAWTAHTTKLPPGGTLPEFPTSSVTNVAEPSTDLGPAPGSRQLVVRVRHVVAIGAIATLVLTFFVGVAVSSQNRAQSAEDHASVLQARLARGNGEQGSSSSTTPVSSTSTAPPATTTTAPDPDRQCKKAMYDAYYGSDPAEEIFKVLDDCTEEQWNRLVASEFPSNKRTLQDLCDSRMGVPATACGSADAARTAREAATTAPPRATVPPTTARPPASGGTVSQRNARDKAASYLDYSSFSRSGLIKQLQFEGFSLADATYGVDAMTVDWNEQAAKKAASYLKYSSFSRSGLVDQLLFEGFSQTQAEYGVSTTGL